MNFGSFRDRFGKLSHRHPGFLYAPHSGDDAGSQEGTGMTAELFPVSAGLARLPLQDAEIFYLDYLELSASPAQVMRDLVAGIAWRSEEIVMWGRKVPQPRLTAWYGDLGASYAYSGLQLDPLPWTSMLLDIKSRVEATVGSRFNSVLLNYYRDHRDSIGFHSDDEPELGRQPVIASLSLGEDRTFILKHKTSSLVRPVHLRLASGSLLLMRGDTQRCWRHGIAKEIRPCGPRVNLTFRNIIH
jgi:alkylated DNA repair dioxygenase AlkB